MLQLRRAWQVRMSRCVECKFAPVKNDLSVPCYGGLLVVEFDSLPHAAHLNSHCRIAAVLFDIGAVGATPSIKLQDNVVFHTYLTIAFLYIALRFVYPLRMSLGAKLGIALLLLVISKYHYLSLIIYGDMWSPELPYPVVWTLGWLFCAFVLLVVFTVVTDLLSLILILAGRREKLARLSSPLRSAAVVLALTLSALGVYQATQVPDVRRVELEVENLPADLEGFRFVQLSDLHISKLFPAAWTRAVVDRTNQLSPDLILISGDLIDGYVEAREADVAPLKDLSARHGVIAIPGNHEFYFDYSKWEPVFEALGMHMLMNENVTVREGSAELAVIGVSDAAAVEYGFPGPDLAKAMHGAPQHVPTILLSHRPEGASESARAGVDLQLSGHTHGGMIVGLSAIAAYANEGYISRDYDVGDMKLYVSNGTGLWMGFPIRLGVSSEITEFILKKRM